MWLVGVEVERSEVYVVVKGVFDGQLLGGFEEVVRAEEAGVGVTTVSDSLRVVEVVKSNVSFGVGRIPPTKLNALMVC